MVKSRSLPGSMTEDIEEFSKKFNLPHLDKPGLLDSELMAFRLDFMIEELNETMNAYYDGNLEEVFDGLLDLMYVTLGTAWMMNLNMEEGWLRVHHANMQKERVKNAGESKRNSPYDLKKPEGWRPPYLKDLL